MSDYPTFSMGSPQFASVTKRGITMTFAATPPLAARMGDLWISDMSIDGHDREAERIGREELSWETREGWERRFNELSGS